MSGSTTWHPRDAAHHDRELIVELLDEFGPGGPYVDAVLRDLAGQQHNSGTVKAGFRSLSKKTGTERDECRRIVEYAAEIGVLDDLQLDADGRRFTCRISGWEADSTRGRAAMKKADARARKREDQAGDASTPTGDTSPSNGDASGSVPPRSDKRREEKKDPQTPKGASRTAEQRESIRRAQAAGFDEWLLDHATVTGDTSPKASTKAYAHLAEMFNGRIADGRTLAELKLATGAAFNDEHRRKNGYYGAESVLRPLKNLELVNKGRRLQVRQQASTTGIDPRRLYGPSDEELAASAGDPIG